MLANGREPEYFEEAMAHQHKNEWVKVMQNEMKSLNENYIYDLVKLQQCVTLFTTKV